MSLLRCLDASFDAAGGGMLFSTDGALLAHAKGHAMVRLSLSIHLILVHASRQSRHLQESAVGRPLTRYALVSRILVGHIRRTLAEEVRRLAIVPTVHVG